MPEKLEHLFFNVYATRMVDVFKPHETEESGPPAECTHRTNVFMRTS